MSQIEAIVQPESMKPGTIKPEPKKPGGAGVEVLLVNMAGILVDLLSSALALEGSIHIQGSAATQQELQDLLDLGIPQVALVGVQGWGQQASILPFLQQLSAIAPQLRMVVIATDIDREDIITLFSNGVRGLLGGTHADIPQLIKCIHCVAVGQIWASSSQLEMLVQSLSLPRQFQVTNVLGESLLSKREEQVLQLLADGLSNRELAAALKLSEHTVKNHLFRIFDKLGVSNRMEAVLYAISQREQRATSPWRTSSETVNQ